MDMNLLKKALPKGILLGIGIALLYVLFRLLLNGGTFFDHLLSTYGILTLICMPIALVAYFYDKEKRRTASEGTVSNQEIFAK